MAHDPGGGGGRRSGSPVDPATLTFTSSQVPIEISGVPETITVNIPFFFDSEQSVTATVAGKPNFSVRLRSIENNTGNDQDTGGTFKSTIERIEIEGFGPGIQEFTPTTPGNCKIRIFYKHP
jgi:hypothetical protein